MRPVPVSDTERHKFASRMYISNACMTRRRLFGFRGGAGRVPSRTLRTPIVGPVALLPDKIKAVSGGRNIFPLPDAPR